VSYLGELRDNLRPLAAASLGCGTSLPLFAYTNSVFAPHLVREFGWSRAQFALIGLTMLTTLFVLPFVGRFTDRLGVRRVALLGTILVPLCFVGYALQNGSFAYFAFCSTMVLAVGSMTGPLVYTRLVAESFERAQGLALTIINCAPAVLAIICVPVLNWTIVRFGWRISYLGLGALALVAGLVALALIRPSLPERGAAPPAPEHTARRDYRMILHSRVFWTIVVAMFLCMLQTPLHSSQMNIMLIDQHLTTQAAANIVSVYALGTIVGRIGCGLALDRFATPIVTCLSMILPALGFFLLATSLDTVEIVTGAMFLVGLSVGAESDLLCYLVARYFKLRIYATTLGLVHCVSFLTSATGAAAISLTLKLTDSFAPFLYLVSGTIAAGALLFLALPGSRDFEKIG
jgi:MFS family permease